MASSADEKTECERFLSKVDELEEIVHGLKSLQSYDDDIAQTVVNKTVINRQAFDSDVNNKDDFKAVIERDAKERAERRRKNMQEAKLYKEKGNAEFKKEQYRKAVDFYGKGIELVKDMVVLYTNRAQAYIKLFQFDKALKDCDKALNFDSKCQKAYLHKGKSYTAMKKFDKALDSYKTAISCDPSKQSIVSLIQGYISEVQVLKKQNIDENMVINDDDVYLKKECIIDVLDTLFKNKTEAMCVSGGLRILQNALFIPDAAIIFRMHGGLRICSEHELIKRCFEDNLKNLNIDEIKVCSSVYACYAAACINDDEHKRIIFIENNRLSYQTQQFLNCLIEEAKTLHVEILAFIRVVTCVSVGVDVFSTKFDAKIFLKSCIDLHSFYEKLLPQLGNDIVAIFMELFRCARFRDKIIKQINEISDILSDFLKKTGNCKNSRLLSSYVSTLTVLARDQRIRKLLSNRSRFFESLYDVLEENINSLASSETHQFTIQRDCILLLTCLYYENNRLMNSKNNIQLASFIYPLLKAEDYQLQQTALHMYSTLLPNSMDMTIEMIKWGFVDYIIESLASIDNSNGNCLIRCLLACTRADQSTCKMLISWDIWLSTLINFLNLNDEKTAGNTALVFTDILNYNKEICVKFRNSDIVQRLLILCKDANCQKVRVNSAIFLSKIVTIDEELKQKLRELEGIGILHNMLKSVKLS